MTQPPDLKHHTVSAEKMRELFNQHKFQQTLSQCRTVKTPQSQGNEWLDSRERKELIRYTEPDTDNEILLAAEYTCSDPKQEKTLILLRLRIDNDIYALRLI
jgi:hypothetical protein